MVISDEDGNDGDEDVDGDGMQNKPQRTKSQKNYLVFYMAGSLSSPSLTI